MLNLWHKIVAFFKTLLYLMKIAGQDVCRLNKSIAHYILKRIKDFWRYVGDDNGILALQLIFNGKIHFIERFFWLLMFIGGICGTLFITNVQIIRFLKSPTVLSLERTDRVWDGIVPAITLCYADKMDTSKASDYIRAKWNVSTADEDYLYFMDFLESVVNSSLSNYAHLTEFAEDERLHKVNIYEIVEAVQKPFEQIIRTSEGSPEVAVNMAMTERGWCYIINSPFSEILRRNFQNFRDLKSPLKCKFGKRKCFIQIDLLKETAVVGVHSPFEISLMDDKVLALEKSTDFTAVYKVSETVADANLRDLTFNQRNCIFNDEEAFGLKNYAKSLCISKCRAQLAIKACNCLPFFYPFFDGTPCDPDSLTCLVALDWPGFAPNACKCPKPCIEAEYTLQTSKTHSRDAKREEYKKQNNAIVSSFRLDLIPSKMRVRREVVFSFEDLLVSFGGTSGLFLGFSALSLVSMTYFIGKVVLEDMRSFMRVTCVCCRNMKKSVLKRWKSNKEIQIVGTAETAAVAAAAADLN